MPAFTQMAIPLNETHDPARRSFVESANAPDCDFPDSESAVRRLSPGGRDGAPRVGVAIGDQILDVAAAGSSFDGAAAEAARACARRRSLNHAHGARAAGLVGAAARAVARLERRARRTATACARISRRWRRPSSGCRWHSATSPISSPRSSTPPMPAACSGPDNPLMPNYKYVPVAYHSRASSVAPSGTPVKRPRGQRKGPNEDAPSYGPSRNLDFELELGMFIGIGDRARRPGPDRQGRGSYVRLLPAQRLVGARHAGLGIPAARSVPRQEFRHHRLAVGGDRGSAGAVPHRGLRAAAGRSGAAAASRRCRRPRQRRPRHHARSLYVDRGDAARRHRAACASRRRRSR